MLKYLFKILIQIGIGISVVIVLLKPFNQGWINIIVFLVVWATLWATYDYIQRKIIEED